MLDKKEQEFREHFLDSSSNPAFRLRVEWGFQDTINPWLSVEVFKDLCPISITIRKEAVYLFWNHKEKIKYIENLVNVILSLY